MEILFTTALGLIAEIAPALTTSTAIQKVINVLAVGVPAAIKTARESIPEVKRTIESLRGNANITAEQLEELDAIEASYDANYEAASAKAKAEDEAAGKT